jgi:outer membrane protein assembly factor BamB
MMMAGVFLISTSAAFAQDWPQWRGANRDGKTSEFVAPEKWPEKLTQKWQVKVGSGDSSPALVGDKLYVFTREGENEVTRCLAAADGKEIWQDKYAATPVTGAAAKHPGPRSSPTVMDGKVITLGVNGVLSCLDAAKGTVLWRKDAIKAVPKFFTAMSPLVVNGMVIAQLGKEGEGGLYAFDLATGADKWKWTAEGASYSSPVVMTVDGAKQIVALSDKSVVGLSTEGKLLWQVAFAPSGMNYNACTPIVDGQTVIFSGKGRGTKAVKVERADDTFAAKELWSNPDAAVQFNTPVLRDGYLYGFADKGTLFCLSAKDGKTAWTDSVNRGRDFAAIVDAGSVLAVLPSSGEMVVFKPSDKALTEVAKFKVSDNATYAFPVLSGDRVFVKDQDNLTLWSTK